MITDNIILVNSKRVAIVKTISTGFKKYNTVLYIQVISKINKYDK